MRILTNCCPLMIAMIFPLVALGSIPKTTLQFVSLQKFGQIQLGESIERFPTLARAKVGLDSARFYFYFLNSGLPAHCLNLECGQIARPVLARGGVLIGSDDDGLGEEIGETSEDPVLLVTDRQGKVTGIYRHFKKQDIHQILRAISG